MYIWPVCGYSTSSTAVVVHVAVTVPRPSAPLPARDDDEDGSVHGVVSTVPFGLRHDTTTNSPAPPLTTAEAVVAVVTIAPVKRCELTETHFDGSPSKYQTCSPSPSAGERTSTSKLAAVPARTSTPTLGATSSVREGSRVVLSRLLTAWWRLTTSPDGDDDDGNDDDDDDDGDDDEAAVAVPPPP